MLAAEALRFIRERVQSLQVAPERPRPGHLYACRLQQAGYSGRPHLFVVGLEEGRVFPSASEDPVLLDAERAAISPALRLSTDRIDEAVYAVLRALRVERIVGTRLPRLSAAAITFSYSCRDTREFRETYASWLMLQAFRLQQGDPARSYQQMKAALGEPVSSRSCATGTPRRPRPAGGSAACVGTGDEGVEAVEASFAALARGAHGRRAARLRAVHRVRRPCAGGRRSARSVRARQRVLGHRAREGGGCPFRFFLKRGLGLRPWTRASATRTSGSIR